MFDTAIVRSSYSLEIWSLWHLDCTLLKGKCNSIVQSCADTYETMVEILSTISGLYKRIQRANPKARHFWYNSAL